MQGVKTVTAHRFTDVSNEDSVSEKKTSKTCGLQTGCNDMDAVHSCKMKQFEQGEDCLGVSGSLFEYALDHMPSDLPRMVRQQLLLAACDMPE